MCSNFWIGDGWEDCVDASDEVPGAVTYCPGSICEDELACNFGAEELVHIQKQTLIVMGILLVRLN